MQLWSVRILTAAAICVALFLAWQARQPETREQYLAAIRNKSTNAMTTLRAEITDLTTKRGARFAVDVVLDATHEKMISSDDCHALLHLVGHQSYQIYGPDVKKVLDTDAGTSCLGGYVHGVEAQILQDGGPMRQTLFELCTAEKEKGVADGPCFHGVGHSALEYSNDVKKSLAVCDSLAGGPEQDLSNCYRGVFSQLDGNLAGMDVNTELPVPRYRYPGLDPKNPYPYCATFDEKYRDACYTQLAQRYASEKGLGDTAKNCMSSSRQLSVEATCIAMNAAVVSRKFIDTGDSAGLAALVNSLPTFAAYSSLSGIKDSIGGLSANAQAWKQFCAMIQNARVKSACNSYD